jgi:hypothetical protein
LRLEDAAEGLRIAFRNPRSRAEIRILDPGGRRLLRRAALAGETFTWKSPPPASVVIIQVLALGEPMASSLWIPRTQPALPAH